MNSKLLVVAALASFGLATTAFAAEGNGDPFPLTLSLQTVTVGNAPRDVGAQAYPAPRQTLATTNDDSAIAPANGGDANVESVNSRPLNWAVGTPQYAQAQALSHWRAEQAEDGYAAAPAAQTHG